MAPKHTHTLASGTVITAAGGAVFVEPEPPPKNANVHFFTRLGGVSEPPFDSLNISTKAGDDPKNVEENLSRIREAMGGNPSAWVRQIAGDSVVRVSEEGFAGEADALITREGNLSLVVGVADCVPVALVGEDEVGMVHSGWRGTLSGVSGKAAREMAEASGDVESSASNFMESKPPPGFAASSRPASEASEPSLAGSNPSADSFSPNSFSPNSSSSNIVAYIGPCIRRCCYEVSEELAGKFADEFGGDVVSGRHLSLPDAIRMDLDRAGVEGIYDLGLCTGCRPDLFFSHRMEKPVTGRSLAAVSKVGG